MTDKKKTQPFSACVSDFVKAVTAAQSDYKWNKDELVRLDEETQDYLHLLELGDLSYSERAKVATKISHTRQARREAKDAIKTLEPIITYLDTDTGKAMLKSLKDVIGDTRKAEKELQNRFYRFRVIEPEGKLLVAKE